MLNVIDWGNSGALADPLGVDATTLVLRSSDAPRFQVPAGDHYYLTLRDSSAREVVRVDATNGRILTIVRGVDNTAARQWAAGTCVAVEWNPLQLREFMESVQQDCEPTGVPAGTFCLSCNTCITVNECGRITQINGAGGCNG